MLTVATLLWSPNAASFAFSRQYTEVWVERLYRGFARNLTRPFRFVCYTERDRTFAESAINQIVGLPARPTYGDCIRPYALNDPMILVGLDTIVCGNIDHLADHCLTADKIALPRDPYNLNQACNGVALVPAGMERIAETHAGENDMAWLRTFPHDFTDDLFEGAIVSYKGTVEKTGLRDAKVVYFHGLKKPHELPHLPWIQEHWR